MECYGKYCLILLFAILLYSLSPWQGIKYIVDVVPRTALEPVLHWQNARPLNHDGAFVNGNTPDDSEYDADTSVA